MRNKNLTTDSIKKLLNQSAHQLDDATLDGLRQARLRALEKQRVQQEAPVLAWLSSHGPWAGSHGFWSLPRTLLTLALTASLIGGIAYFQAEYEHEHDHSDIDIAILTDDLPVDAYID